MVDVNDGITIIPELVTFQMPKNELRAVRHFKNPAPMREVSLVVHGNFVKKRLVDSLKKSILDTIPEKLRQNKKKNVIPIQL